MKHFLLAYCLYIYFEHPPKKYIYLKGGLRRKSYILVVSIKGQGDHFLEEDEQLDRVLTSLVEAQTTRCHNQVAFVMDVLLTDVNYDFFYLSY